MFTRDWASEPVPSRGTSKDRRRQMEGEQLKREAEERAGRSLGEERYADRDRYADRRYDRGGDRYGDRGGDRYGDRGRRQGRDHTTQDLPRRRGWLLAIDSCDSKDLNVKKSGA